MKDEDNLNILQKPDWTDIRFERNYVVTFKLLKKQILLCEAKGYCSLNGVKQALEFSTRIIEENFATKSYIYMEDFSELNGISNEARRYYISHMQAKKAMRGLIYYNVSSIFKLSIRLAQRLNIINFEVFITDGLRAAVNLAKGILNKHQSSADNLPSTGGQYATLSSFEKSGVEKVTSGLLYQSDNFEASYQVFRENIYHTVSTGLFKEIDVSPIIQANRKVISANWGNRESYYFVAGIRGVKVTKASRQLYLREVVNIFQDYPFKMVIFYGVDWLTRAAINMGRAIVPFPVQIVNSFDQAVELISRRQQKLRSSFKSRVKGKKSRAIPEDKVLKDVDKILEFLGNIDWEMDGIGSDSQIHSSPVFSPVYDAIAMIKMEMDELYNRRKLAEEQRNTLQKKLEHSMKMEAVGIVAGGVAHDLNNILGSMVSYPEILLLELPKDSPLRSYVQSIYQSGVKAATIVQDLLTLTRRGVAISEPVNMNTVIRDYLVSPEFKKLERFHTGVRIITHLDEELRMVDGSPVHLQKTIMNLISNAAEAIPDGGTVSIYTGNCSKEKNRELGESAVEFITIQVSDTGVGIPENELEKIFEPFYTKKKMGRSGTGLGMAVVWTTVNDHNGFIDVKSSLDKGTTIILYLPVTDKISDPVRKKSRYESLKGQRESILVVDDVLEQREVASAILSRLGYQVSSVGSGEEAVEYIANNPTDLLLLDMIMDPGIDGLETYRRILKLNSCQKAIIASGFSEPKAFEEVSKMGHVRYLKKPYTIQQIGEAVKEILESIN